MPVDPDREQLLSGAYAWLELIVGVIAITLPVVLPVTDWLIDDESLRGSISSYYYGRPKIWFVGSLFALGVFFLSYEYPPRRGFRVDFWCSVAASLAAIGVAMCPTASAGERATGGEALVATLHLVFAGTLFVLLAFFCLRFSRALTALDEGVTDTLRRGLRTPAEETPGSRVDRVFPTVFRVAAAVIVGCIGAILLVNLRDWEGTWVYWFEAIAVEAFGVAWFVRSRQRRVVRAELEPLLAEQHG